MAYRILGAILACSVAAACAVGSTPTVAPTAASNESACVSYGFVPGTTPYTTCVQREAAARQRGRLGPNYDETLIARDAQEDCASYGVARGTPVFQQCVQHEISYRRPN
jgi:hypothetical protein